jgi:hypothetical protein
LKYLVPLFLFAAPLCPHNGLSTYGFAAYFVAGLFATVWAYEKGDVPWVANYTEVNNGE